jgi:hypothetical protein
MALFYAIQNVYSLAKEVLSVAKSSGGFLIAKRTFAGQGNFQSDRQRLTRARNLDVPSVDTTHIRATREV